jgi:hypothetical protein
VLLILVVAGLFMPARRISPRSLLVTASPGTYAFGYSSGGY